MTAPERRQRSSNIEILRILAMLMIVMHHFAIHSGFTFPDPAWSWNRLFVQSMSFGGKIGVDIFVIISGFFLVRQTFRLQKFFRLVGQIWFYTIMVLVVTAAVGGVDALSAQDTRHALLPLWPVWWFASGYIVLYMLFPFLNIAIAAAAGAPLRRLLALLTVLWCLIPWSLGSSLECSNLGWFVYLYLLGAWFRLEPGRVQWLSRHAGSIALGSFAITIGQYAIGDLIQAATQGAVSTRLFHGIDLQNPVTLLLAIGLFFFFERRRDIGTIPWINKIAATMFGVYLIHDHPIIRSWIWQHVFGNQDRAAAPDLAAIGLAEVAAVFLVCSAIDALRIRFAERPFFAWLAPRIDHFEAGPWRRLQKFIE
ncbi:acyltransferase [uncultured Selenomonas sp.]|uniref:acyltransferase n=1 Tax=uncultured Selenomonas sp. TaxID=159275 RepID=UPI0025FF2CCF|nr:acyltransferase [uncultured Selenomonas sp.]